jgi:predicted amidohydrolase
VNVVALQYDIPWKDKAANFAKVRKLLTQAAPDRDSLVVLPNGA